MLRASIKKQGFTMLEIAISMGIIILISILGIRSFSKFRGNNALGVSRDTVVTALLEARNLTLFSKEASVYGVHFASTTITIFKGATYIPNASSNKIYNIDSSVVVSNLNLNPFAYDVLFARLTGLPDRYGNIELKLISGTKSTSSVSLGSGGIAQ